ncbi:MAG: hypothetical protein R3E90_10660 [Marinicella sp.]
MKTILLIAFLSLSFHVFGDVLLIERIEAKQGVSVPAKSATMVQVRSHFGDPMHEYPAVGNPPITRWEYENFLVYFEHEHVITSVLKKSKPTEEHPKPVK